VTANVVEQPRSLRPHGGSVFDPFAAGETADPLVQVGQDAASPFEVVHARQPPWVRPVPGCTVLARRHLDAETREHCMHDLQRVRAELSVVMAMGLASLGQAHAARRWWATARVSADQSGATGTRMWVRDWESVNGLYERRPHSTILTLVDEGLAVGGSDCVGKAGLLSGRAQTLSVRGRQGEAIAALQELEAVTSVLPSAALRDIDSMHGWPEFRLRHTESYVYTHLGMTGEAMAAQDLTLAMYPPELARERTQLQTHRAACLVLDGDINDGLSYAHTALDELPGQLHNALLFQIAARVLDVLPPGERTRPSAKEFQRRITPSTAVRA
jgi:hypothetical protein